MKKLIFILFPLNIFAQITTITKVIYKANKADTISVGFSPSGEAKLTVSLDNSVIDNNVILSGYHVLNLTLDSGSVVTASGTGTIGYTVYKNGIDVTPLIQADNSFTEFLNWFNSLTAANQRRVIVYGLWKQGFSLKDLKKSQ